MGKYDDIFKRARKIDDFAKRCRYLKRAILIRHEGFSMYYLRNFCGLFTYHIPKFFGGVR